ncbi:MAG: IS1595 family transposase [Acidobacteria bacterium]|nr:IS1595 family transposase [Acidobacteriota bacterium]
MRKKKEHPELKKSALIRRIPLACASELAAVELLEEQRWPDGPQCVHCESRAVYQMKDAATGQRNKRFLWRCRDCKRQYTVRVGSVYEESRLPLRHWVYAFWMSASGKNGVSAREIQRHCQITYRAALFLLHRVRWAMATDLDADPKLDGIIEADETYVGGKPRFRGQSKRGRGTRKTPVFACVARDGEVRAKVIPNVTAETLQEAIIEVTAPSAKIVTDDHLGYRGVGRHFAGGHESVNHSAKEYVRKQPKDAVGPVIHTNTIEGFFSLLKRGLHGTYHAVSKQHLHRYLAEFAFRYNTRSENDGDRLALLIRRAEGKRLSYRDPVAKTQSK